MPKAASKKSTAAAAVKPVPKNKAAPAKAKPKPNNANKPKKCLLCEKNCLPGDTHCYLEHDIDDWQFNSEGWDYSQ